MAVNLSKNEIRSFCGDVVPLRLLSDRDISQADIRWSADGDAVHIRTFAEGEYSFTNGVLLTLVKEGKAAVTAELDGEKYICPVYVRAMRHASPEDSTEYFVGDFHLHTTSEHNHDRFAVRTAGFPIDGIRRVRDENKLDFHVVSDHASTLNQRDFFRGFTDVEDAGDVTHIVFPGCESEVTIRETDRYGYLGKPAGEIVTVNASNYSNAYSWEEFFTDFSDSPYAVAVLAHPQIIGHSVRGVWNFHLEKNNSPRFREMVKMVEMGNGGDRKSNVINEYVYSVALDNGFDVSTTCSSDCHHVQKWGAEALPGRTIIMAPERSKEAFIDAILHNRVYGCSSGNLKLRWSVNGQCAPCTLADATEYRISVRISYFRDAPSTVPVKCQLISDGGRVLHTLEGENLSEMDFTVTSDTARYFYLRLIDGEGRKTWSPPVRTGRAVIPAPTDTPSPLSKAGWTAYDQLGQADASVLLSDNPAEIWQSAAGKASIVIDMQKEHTVCAFGHYPQPIDRPFLLEHGTTEEIALAELAAEYVISVSLDGEHYTQCDEGFVRTYGGEAIFRFPQCRARYVKFDVLSTTGRASEMKNYADAQLSIGELTVYGEI